ncbi:hypothetical protein BGZ49_006954 [Haplosporangium sp. Z 27]|nr:hypothetical protein BGZ49_006954 [Haplosporangium sp. Z 27]
MYIRSLTLATLAITLATCASSVAAAGVHQNSTDHAAKYRINTAKLPGLDKSLVNLPQWSGELPVSKGNSLFFWYIQAKNVASDNLIFWYNGGPGCTSMEGLFSENGPYQTKDDGQTWKMNPYSWHNAGHVVYIDQPFGTGFSFSNTTVPNEDFIGEVMVDFYLNFFKTFPEMRHKKVYLTGESYAGRYIPYFAKHVLDYNEKHKSDTINLQALAIGGAYLDTGVNTVITNSVPFLEEHPWVWGKNQTWLKYAKESAEKAKKLPNCAYAKSDADLSQECMELVQEYSYSTPAPVDCPLPANCTFQGRPLCYDAYNIGFTDCDLAKIDYFIVDTPYQKYLNLPAVQEQIHIGKPQTFIPCSEFNTGFYALDPSIVPKYFIGDLVDRGLKVTLYSGLLDLQIPHSTIEAAIREMTWKGHKGFVHSKLTVATMTPMISPESGKPVGRYHSERGMNFVIFNNAGHMVPRDVRI